MNQKYLKTLEYHKILDILKKYVQSECCIQIIDDMTPSTDFESVYSSLEDTKDALSLVTRKGTPPLGGIKDVRPICKRLSKGADLNNTELITIRDNLYIAGRNKRYLYEKNEDFYNESLRIRKKLENLYENKSLESEIQRCILSEDEIADDASKTLSNIRRTILNKQQFIKNKLNDYIRSSKYSKYIQDAVVTIRNDRYVIPIKQEHRGAIKGLLHDTSSSGSTLYIEPMDIVNANNDIQQLKNDEKKEIELILAGLSDIARECIGGFETNFDLLTFADIVFAKASMALNENYTIPRINNDKYIRLVKARHPLIDKNEVVPIDFHIGEEFDTLVITGPNTGGKTVSLKTVGLLTLMMQSGMGVPASDGTEMAVFSKIYADIGDEQSIEQSLSTFSSHMQNIISILKDCDKDSLVLLDELGAGTDPSEGSALALAILEKLMAEKCTTVATTHYQQIKIYASATGGIENASCEFDVRTLSPTYKLLIGIPGKSNALYISRRLGLSQDIIKNAGGFIDGDTLDYEDVILSLEKNRQRIEKEKIKALNRTKKANEMKSELEKKLASIEHEKKRILEKAKKDAQNILRQSKQEADEFLKQLDEMKRTSQGGINARDEADFKRGYKAVFEKNKQSDEKEIDGLKNTTNSPVVTSVLPGDDVRIMDINQPAVVLEEPDKNNEVLVQAGIMKIKVNISNLAYDDSRKNANKKKYNTYNVNRNQKVETELDIRGMASDEIDMMVGKFIDNALIHSLEEVYIIHGKGTGRLRKAVHDILKANPRVVSYRLGKYGEGEDGVTVAKLK